MLLQLLQPLPPALNEALPNLAKLDVAAYAHIINACCQFVWMSESAPPSPKFNPDDRDTFTITDKFVGQGAFGTVSIVTAEQGTRVMAVKATRGTPTDLRKEIHMILRVGPHRNIVTYFATNNPVDVTWDSLRIFMEFVGGGTITNLTKALGGVYEQEASAIVFQVLCGLEHIHECKVIHRDIKGQNILISLTGCVKITDMGVSRLDASNVRTFVGSAPFIAPEVVTGHQSAYGQAVDIWSVGAVVVELLQGGHPWAGLDEIPILFKVSQFEWPKPSSMSSALEDLLTNHIFCNAAQRATAKDLLVHSWFRAV
ncbi:kinase-like domain-containing protein [Mycena filopes]|nr:kinase-like domain-containing protein [Mycena filopes]